MKRMVTGAMFDVKPVDQAGRVNFLKIQSVVPVVNLRKGIIAFHNSFIPQIPLRVKKPARYPLRSKKKNFIPEPPSLSKPSILKEFEEVFAAENNGLVQLARSGAQILPVSTDARPRYKPILRKVTPGYEEMVSQILQPFRESSVSASLEPALAFTDQLPGFNRLMPLEGSLVQGSRELESRIEKFFSRTPASVKDLNADSIVSRFGDFIAAKRTALSRSVLLAGAIASLAYLGKYGLDFRRELVSEGNSAVSSLENAGGQLKALDFAAASNSFAQAYEQFTQAGDRLNFLGANLSAALADLPGASKLKSTRSVVEIGRLIAEAGKAMAEAVSAISKTGTILNPQNALTSVNSSLIRSLEDALVRSEKNLDQAGLLFAQVDQEIIPAERRPAFKELGDKIPQFQRLVKDSIGYAGFLEKIIGSRGTKRYLILFQNYSELRPAGGFPGTYGVMVFQDGKLKDFFVDDVYNLDGQLKEQIIPPRELQHITPTWGMRDANWFADFPTSAKKVSSFFKKEAGYEVDGVITVSPRIIEEALKVVGPIQMSSYDKTITSENFLASIQEEVEYGANRVQPKQIIKDLAPLLLDKLSSADPDAWLKVFNVFVSGLEQKDILMYFRDVSLQNFVIDHGFSGQVASGDTDYLMAVVSNVKGSKTDRVTDTHLKLTTVFEDGALRHRLFITRKHNGGSTPYGFYNRQNSAYVRVLVPKGSELLDIVGNDNVKFSPLVDYSGSLRFKRDPDLKVIEEAAQGRPDGATIYQESGKTAFGFWMIVNPGQTKTVELNYIIPSYLVKSDYEMVIQKQPGLEINSFEFVVDPPEGAKIVQSAPALDILGSVYTLTEDLEKDLPIRIRFE